MLNFTMNDKCAAGTGRFLGAASFALEMPLSRLGPLALQATSPVRITTTCTVFAESEIISHLAGGVPAEDIMMGAMVALGGRAVQLMRRVGLEPAFMLTGGMTRNAAMVLALEESLKAKLQVAPDGLGQLNGAYGAALLGLLRVQKLIAEGKPIPATASRVTNEAPAKRRWSAIATKKAAPPCATGACPTPVKIVRQPLEEARA